MAISINWPTGVISIPKSDLTLISGDVYEYDVNAFRLELKDLEDDSEGMMWPDTHRHNTSVTLSGVVYARVVEIINGYTVTFENGMYAVNLYGANHNIIDVNNRNMVGVASTNSAGLIEVASGANVDTDKVISHVWAASGRSTA